MLQHLFAYQSSRLVILLLMEGQEDSLVFSIK